MTSLLRKIPVPEISTLIPAAHLSWPRAARWVGLAVVLYMAVLTLAGISTMRAAEALSDTDAVSTLAGGSGEIDKLDDTLAVFDYRLRRLKTLLIPTHLLFKVAGVIPPIGRQVEGTELVIERVERNYDAAVAALASGRSTVELQDTFNSGAGSISDADESSSLKESLERLGSDSTQVLSELDRAADVGRRFEKSGASGPLASVNDRISNQETRLAGLAEFSLLLSEVVLADLDLLGEVKTTSDELRLFVSGDRSIGQLSDRVELLAVRTDEISAQAVRMSTIAPAGLTGTQYSEIVRDLRDLNVVINDLIEGLDTVLDTVSDSFEALASTEGALFEDGVAISNMLNTLIDREEELSSSARQINESIEALLEIDESGLFSIGEFGDLLSDRTGPLLELADLLETAPRVVAEIFGVDGQIRRYLVLGQTSDELRAAGGFTSSAWLLTFQSGVLVDSEYIDIATIADQDSLDDYPAANEELQLHMDAGRMFIRDTGWDPHFPNVGRLTTDIFEIQNPERIDGVISMTQWAFIDIASAVGGLEIDSQTVSSAQLLKVIEDGTDEQGTEFLAKVFDSMMASLSGERLQTRGYQLIKVISSLFGSKNLMIYSEDESTQQLIGDAGWSGALPISNRDRLAIIDSNVGWNKVDRNIDREFVYEVDLADLANPQARLSIGYANSSEPSIDACDVQRLVPKTYAEYLNGCYWNYLRIYFPIGAQLVESDELPLTNGSIAVHVGGFRAGSSSVHQMFDGNGDYISGLMAVEPQSSQEAVFSYRLPKQVLSEVDEGFEYALDIPVQAGTRGRSGIFRLKLPSGYDVVSTVPDAIIEESGSLVIALDGREDVEIRVFIRQSVP
jgi:hypothetical protein